jgi:hypothetical protein
MKNITSFTIAVCCGILLWSCKKDPAVGTPIDLEPEYALPQGAASQEANDKIQSIYDNYGSYMLYNFTQKDYSWVQSSGNGNSAIDTAVLGDPQYVGDMIQFLDDIWLKFLPEDFKKGPGLPYRIFLCDTIKTRRNGIWPPERQYLFDSVKVRGKAIAFAGMNSSLRTMTPEHKRARKNAFISVIFNYYLGNGIIDIPQSFYNMVDYVNMPELPVSSFNPENNEAYRNRGFLPSQYLTSGMALEWLSGAYFWSTANTYDAASYIFHITSRTDEQMAPYLDNYPLIKERFDLLVNHFNTKYGIDVRAMANATF